MSLDVSKMSPEVRRAHSEYRKLWRRVIVPRKVFDVAEKAVRSVDPAIADFMIENLESICAQINAELLARKINTVSADPVRASSPGWRTNRGDAIDGYQLDLRRALAAQEAPDLKEAWSIILTSKLTEPRHAINVKLRARLPLTEAEREIIQRDLTQPPDRPPLPPFQPDPKLLALYVKVIREVIAEHPTLFPVSKHKVARPSMDVPVDSSVRFAKHPTWMRDDPFAPFPPKLRKNPLPAAPTGSDYQRVGSAWWLRQEVDKRLRALHGTAPDSRADWLTYTLAMTQVLMPEGWPPQPQRGERYTLNELREIVSVAYDVWPPMMTAQQMLNAEGRKSKTSDFRTGRSHYEINLGESITRWRNAVAAPTSSSEWASWWFRKRAQHWENVAALNLDVDEKDPGLYAFTPANLSKICVGAFNHYVVPALARAAEDLDPRLYGFGADPDKLWADYSKRHALRGSWGVDERDLQHKSDRETVKERMAIAEPTVEGVHAGASDKTVDKHEQGRREFAMRVLRLLRADGVPYGQTSVTWQRLKRAVEKAGGKWKGVNRFGGTEIEADPALGGGRFYTANHTGDAAAQYLVATMLQMFEIKWSDLDKLK